MHFNEKFAGARWIAIAALLFGGLSFGHAQNVENQIIASQFGQFKLYGLNDGFNFPPASCQLSAGNKNFVAFQQGVPVRVVDTGTPSLTETVTAGPVSITTCAVSLPVTNFHASFYVTSGTAGLQEAINANGPGSFANTVILDNAWYALGGDSSIISSVKGFLNLGLVDITQTPYVWYAWNGSQYVETAVGGAVSSVFGRTGAVAAETGDYTCGMVTGCGMAPNGIFTSALSAAVGATDQTIPLSSSTAALVVPGYLYMPASGEWILYTGKTGDSVTGATRGAHQTAAAAYGSGTSAVSVISDFGNPAQAPQNFVVSNLGSVSTLTVINCAVADETSNILVQVGCPGSSETRIDTAGAITQTIGSDENIFESEVGIGPGGGFAPITNSGLLFDSTRQNQSTVPQGFGAGLAGPVTSIQPPTIAAPSIVNFANTGSTTWSYECTGTDIDGNTFPGTVASITNGPATITSGEMIVSCPFSAGAATQTIWRTAGGPNQGAISIGGQPAEVSDGGISATPGTPPSTNSSVPKACVGGSEVSCWITSASAPTGSCTNGWFDTNQSGSPATLYQCVSGAWTEVGGGGGSSPFQSLTTTGTSGPATLISGVLNIPEYSGGGGGTTQVISGLAYSPSDTTIVATWYTSGNSNSALTCGSKTAVDNNFQASVTFHEAGVSGLSPTTAYSCTVSSGATTSSPQSVTTLAAATRTPITAMSFGSPTTTTVHGDTVYSTCDLINCYVTEDDGQGFTGTPNAGANMQISQLTNVATLTGLNTNLLTNYGPDASSSGTDGPGGSAQTNKVSGIFGMGGALYLFANRDTYGSHQNAWYGNVLKSTDHGATWNTWQNPQQFSPNGVPPVPLGSFQWSPTTWGWCNPVRYAEDDGSNGYLTPGNRFDGADLWVYGSCTDGYWNNSSNLYMWRMTRASFASQNPGAIQYWIGPTSPTNADFVNDSNWTSTFGTPTAIYSAANETSSQDITFVAGFDYYVLGEWYQVSTGTSDDTVWNYYSAPTPAGPWTSIGTKTNNPSGYYNPVILHRTAATNSATTEAALTIVYSGDYDAGEATYYYPTYSTILLNPSTGDLLDQTAAAAGAWSVSHVLRAAYSGALINIERASDSTTTDVSATSGAINQSTINTFCSGTTCYVDKIYDQSGNGLNVTQATQANMPIIYQSGAIVTSGTNSEVAMSFDGTNRFLSATTTTGGAEYEALEVENLAGSISYGGAFALTDSANDNCGSTAKLACFSMTDASSEAVTSFSLASGLGPFPVTYGTQFLQDLEYNAGTLSGSINGGSATTVGGAYPTLTGTLLVIGNAATNASGTAWDGSISDVVLWATNLTSGQRSAGVAVEQAFFGGLLP